MKSKIFILLSFILISVNIFSQVDYYTANQFSIKYRIAYDSWSNWSQWTDCLIDVKVDLEENKFIIYSNSLQIYKIVDHVKTTENESESVMICKIIDQDQKQGYLHLRVFQQKYLQLYIEFNDRMWVYNLNKRW